MRLFLIQSESSGFFFLITQRPPAKWSHWLEKLDAIMARSAERIHLLSLLFFQKNRNKVKLLCTVLHNNDGVTCCYIMITHLKACWIAIMPLFE